jgi:hypothetical protein
MIKRLDAGAARLGFPLLVLLAFAYYISYFLNGLNLGGEGGTTAVLAQRLMEGQRPIADTFLGYNVMWFLPVTWIFSFVGPDFLAMKAWFFALAGASGLLGWAVVLRVARSGLLALGVGVAIILIPGMLFRNYMGFLAVANQLALVSAFALPPARASMRVALVALAGCVVGVTFLVRVELGFFMLVLWMGLLLLSLLDPRRALRARLVEFFAGGLAGILLLVAVHAPFVADARAREYAPQFFSQYTGFFALLHWELGKEIDAWHKARDESRPEAVAATDPAKVSHARTAPGAADASDAGAVGILELAGDEPVRVVAEVDDGRRPRPPVSEIVSGRKDRDRFFAAAFYLPAVLAPVLAFAGWGLWALAVWKRDAGLWRDGEVVLITVGCALTLFPQYFFFRPDTPHLSEFMVPFLVAGACAASIAVRRGGTGFSARVIAALVVVALALQVWIHFGHAFPKESSGSIAARKHAPELFTGQNNVRALLREKDAGPIRAMHDLIVSNSAPDDWVLCLPYSPTINFMTARRSYLWDLYTDNTLAGPEFDATRIRELNTFQPAVVVIDHRPINKTEESRFPNWAPKFYNYLRAHYTLAGEFLGNEVFLRKDSDVPSKP